jgi:hypothetical protein
VFYGMPLINFYLDNGSSNRNKRKNHKKAKSHRKKSALHIVSAWACDNSHIMRIKVDDKSNEITAIPKLLEILDIKDSIITIDAMDC